MPTGFRARAHARAIGSICLLAATTLAVQPAVAAVRDKKLSAHPVAASAVPASTTILQGTVTLSGPRTPALRFFTISQVLAKRDAGETTPAAIRQAALSPPPNGPISDGVPAGVGTRLNEPFGLAGFPAPGGTLTAKWAAAKAAVLADLEAVARCEASPEACSPVTRRFLALTADARGHEGLDRLERVTRGVNGAIRYQSDLTHHGVVDRWSSPLETIGSTGDCEDYAIAKFAILQKLGVPLADLRIVLLRDIAIGEDHAVTSVRTTDGWRVLDNRRGTALRDVDLPNYVALAAIDDANVKLLAAPYAMLLRDSDPTLVSPGADDLVPGGGGQPSLP